MTAIPNTVRVTPARVWAAGSLTMGERKTRNLFPFSYDTDADMIRAGIAKTEADRARAYRRLAIAMRNSEVTLVRATRKEIERLNNYIRNGKERLCRLQAAKETAMNPAG